MSSAAAARRAPAKPISTALELLIRRTERALGLKRYRKINLWLSPEQHAELSRQAHAYAEGRDHQPSVHRYIIAALKLPAKKKPRPKLRSV
jgi:hypothetical protein